MSAPRPRGQTVGHGADLPSRRARILNGWIIATPDGTSSDRTSLSALHWVAGGARGGRPAVRRNVPFHRCAPLSSKNVNILVEQGQQLAQAAGFVEPDLSLEHHVAARSLPLCRHLTLLVMGLPLVHMLTSRVETCQFMLLSVWFAVEVR